MNEYKDVVIDTRPLQEILDTIKPGDVIPVWKDFADDGSFAIASVTYDKQLQVFTNIPEELMRPGFAELAEKGGLKLDYRCIHKDEPVVASDELPFPEEAIPDEVTEQPQINAETPSAPISDEVKEMPAEEQNGAPERPDGLTSSQAPSAASTSEIEPTGDTPAEAEKEGPVNDRLSRNKLLNRMYSPEEIEILRKAANNKPTATLGEDMRKAYATKAPQDAKMGIGDIILGAVWTIVTLPVVIPWNILKVSAVTVGHFANKSANVRMAKAAVTEVPKYRKEHDTRKETEKPSLMERLKGFFSKLFKRKDEPVAAQATPEVATPNVAPAVDNTGKTALGELIQEAHDTPDKAPAAPSKAPEKETSRE